MEPSKLLEVSIMHEISKERFGAFVAEERKAQNLTQSQLADKVGVSNKAVSKWETGVSLPDVAILIPLSEALGVTVTELLEGRRIEPETHLDSSRVEELVQTVIRYPETDRFADSKRRWRNIYWLCLLAAATEAIALHFCGFPLGSWTEPLWLTYVFGIIFGAYFLLLVQPLPPYYDQYRINGMFQGPIRMNVPGLRFSNRNWPHIVRVGQIWSMSFLVGYPAVYCLMYRLFPEFWGSYERYAMLALLLCGLFLPMYLVGKKYE